ncbi:MAG TPA: hypothetical protein DCK76_07090 [Desulfotomaculum sp.]|nr:MAG: hypothetical protein XD84_0769 [Desulfotomaculum sp. 46_80]KUK85253.1 MAG: hypothetical protein XE00_0196 [Desulfofundulus kuznetsovii]HAG11133.1 hypothetical protein [Desulfotomaculum sp.]HBY03243.1 hypothetical protein [Desulfotomaculum sp.]
MLGFNPFVSPRADQIRQKINSLKQNHPDLSNREIAGIITSEKCLKCALVGIITALPALVPGAGSLISLLGGAAIDILLFTYLLATMVVEIAAVFDRDLTGRAFQKEAFWAFLIATGTGSAGSKISQSVVAALTKETLNEMTERALISLGVRSTARVGLIRIIPFLGLLFTGGINYWVSKAIGKRALIYYENRNFADERPY